MPDHSLREKLAELEHRQWSHWYRYMIDNLTPENRERWDGQASTPYELLSDVEKIGDREWADKVLEIIRPYLYEQEPIETTESAPVAALISKG